MNIQTLQTLEEYLNIISKQALEESLTVASRSQLEQYKAKLVGSNGTLTACMKQMNAFSNQEKPLAGKLINQTKKQIENILEQVLQKVESIEIQAMLGPSIDPTLPSTQTTLASKHPLSLTKKHLMDVFKSLGFAFVEGTEIESEWYCFDALNTPATHPARDAQDTLYLPSQTVANNVSKKLSEEQYVLRTHTSSVQIRTLIAQKPPIKIASIGRCFRRDTVDATHSANFHQYEGLYVAQNVSVKDLKATLDTMIHELFGKNTKTRLRPSYFPFTEPSFELDICLQNAGKLSGRWLEMLGCGLVHPNVFSNVGYEKDQWSGFAFGGGLERMAMVMYGIDDIRHFYNNDFRFLHQFI